MDTGIARLVHDIEERIERRTKSQYEEVRTQDESHRRAHLHQVHTFKKNRRKMNPDDEITNEQLC